jgi:hypothetical protein
VGYEAPRTIEPVCGAVWWIIHYLFPVNHQQTTLPTTIMKLSATFIALSAASTNAHSLHAHAGAPPAASSMVSTRGLMFRNNNFNVKNFREADGGDARTLRFALPVQSVLQQQNFRSDRKLKNGVGTGIVVGLLTGNPLAGLAAGAVADGVEHTAAAENAAAAEDNADAYVESDDRDNDASTLTGGPFEARKLNDIIQPMMKQNFRSDRKLKNGVGTGIVVGLLTGNPLAGLAAGAVADGAEHVAAASAKNDADAYVESDDREVAYP